MNEINEMQMAAAASQTPESGKVAPRRPSRSLPRRADYLTEQQVETLIKAAERTRYPERDRTLVYMMFRYGLRSIEAVNLTWSQVHFDTKVVDIIRAKNGKDSYPPLWKRGARWLKALQAKLKDSKHAGSEWVFTTERGDQMTTSNIRKLLARLGVVAKLPVPVHPHMLRHSCGHYLAEHGEDTRGIQDYLGHQNIAHTVRYTQGTASRFKDYFKD